MKIKIETIDHDIVLRIPADLAMQADITADSVVDVFVDEGSLVFQKQGYKRKKYTLEELCEQITDENRHDLQDWGPPVGKEIW